VPHVTQMTHECVPKVLKLSSNVNECKPLDEGEVTDKRLQKDGLHTSLFNWLVHGKKLPSIVSNEIDNRSCWALAGAYTRPLLSST